MGKVTGKVLLNSISRYIHLVSCHNVIKPDVLQRDYRTMAELLKLLKPELDKAVIEFDIYSMDLVKEFEELDLVINEVQDNIENWCPKMSKILHVLRIEPLVLKTQKCCLEICTILNRLLPPPPIDASLKAHKTPTISSKFSYIGSNSRWDILMTPLSHSCPNFQIGQRCLQELRFIECGTTFEVIEKSLRAQEDNVTPQIDDFMKIADLLDLASSKDLFMENIAMEKEKEVCELRKRKIDSSLIDQVINLLFNLRDAFIHLKKYGVIRGRQVPRCFCCPLSMELMLDPVIVASGQTFERVLMQKWLDHGLKTCPTTHQLLAHMNLTPNDTVRALISDWSDINNIRLVSYATPKSPYCSSPHNTSHFVGRLPVLQYNDKRLIEAIRSISPDQIEASRTSSGGHVEDSEFARSPNFNNQTSASPGTMSIASKRRNPFTKGSWYQDDKNVNYEVDNLSSCDQSSAHSRTDSLSSVISSIGCSHMLGTDGLDETSRMLNLSICNEASSAVISHQSGRSSPWLHRRHHSSSTVGVHIGETECGLRSPSALSSHGFVDNAASNFVQHVQRLVDGLRKNESQMPAAAELRLLAKYDMENRVIIAECGAISPLISLLYSQDKKLQEHAVTALLNLSINDQNKHRIAEYSVIEPLIHVLKSGNPEAKANAAATLFSLSVMEEYKAMIGSCGAIQPLAELLDKGSLRGKKDAATALFNLSIFHDNKARIVKAGVVRYLVKLILDPESGMVDKAVAILSNLSTITEGRSAIFHEGGIAALVDVLEFGSPRGKENVASTLMQLCTCSPGYSSQVLQEGAIPALVALSQSGTPRAKEKARQILSYFRNQREGTKGQGTSLKYQG